MAVEIFMPKAGMDMQEGKIIQWLKQVGESVEVGEGILEIETDKIAMEVEAAIDGVLLCTYYNAGDVVPVVTTIGYIGEEGEIPPALTLKTEKNEAVITGVSEEKPIERLENTVRLPATPYAKKLATENNIDLQDVMPTGSLGEIKGRDVEKKIKETPLAKRIAEDKGIDIKSIQGSGFQNKVTKADVLAKAEERDNKSNTMTIKTPLTGIKKIVAERMAQAHSEIPCVTQNTRVDTTNLITFRQQINGNRDKKFTINDLVIKAIAKALKNHKAILVSLGNNEIIQHEEINIGVAVALEEGLIVPVVKNADKKSLEEIADTVKDLATRAKMGGLKMDEYRGSTITVSNLGMFGIHSFTPIINQPNAVMLGICAIEDELAMVEGEIVNRKKMMICLTLDHRLLNGDVAARFVLNVKELLENPMEIIL